MRLSQIEKFLGLTNSKEIIRLLVDKDDEEIDLIYNIFQNKINRTDFEMISLIKKYFEFNKDERILLLISNIDIIEHRTFDEQVKLIGKIFELDICENSLELFYNEFILLFRSFDEQVKLIDKYIGRDKDINVFQIITDSCMLKNRTCEQQLYLIDKYMEFNQDEFILQLICNNKLLDGRIYEEQIKLIDIYIQSNCDKNIVSLILNVCCDNSFDCLNNMINKYINLGQNEDVFSIISKVRGTEEEKKLLMDRYVKSRSDKGVCMIMLEGDYTPSQRLYLIDKYNESGKNEKFLKLIPFSPLCSYELLLQSIDKYFEENEIREKNIFDLIDELSSLREVIGILRENDITEFDLDTKVNVYSNK